MDTVAAIRGRIAALQLVECRMAHERVRVEQGRIVRRCAEGAEDVLGRQPLCSRETRTLRLACGHTTARDEMQHVLVDLRDLGVLSADVCAALRAELQAIGDDIHNLDHRKGDAEKQYALAAEACEDAGAAPALEQNTALVRALESEHLRHVERLADWRARVCALIDAATGR